MSVPKVVYRNNEEIKDSWVRYILGRIYNKNKNFLTSVIGPTGSGKTYAGLVIGEKLSAESGVPFSIDNVIFTLKDLMSLVNSNKLKKGSVILFDEPQVSISSREFQSRANKVFNYLLTTFRHRNFILLFCTPYEDLLDKTARKLFHAKFRMKGIDKSKGISKVSPLEIEYNSNKQKFYVKFLRVYYKPENKQRYIYSKVRTWKLPLPSKELVKQYEAKKLAFTKDLNIQIEMELDKDNKRIQKEAGRKQLTDIQERTYRLLIKFDWDIHKVAEVEGVSFQSIYERISALRKKDYPVKMAQYSR